jgi:hypothetical protein
MVNLSAIAPGASALAELTYQLPTRNGTCILSAQILSQDAAPSNNRATRTLIVGEPANMTVYIAPLEMPTAPDANGTLRCKYKLIDENNIPLQGFFVKFNVSANYTGKRVFVSCILDGEEGVVEAVFELAGYDDEEFVAEPSLAKLGVIEVKKLVQLGDCGLYVWLGGS